jgi:hypothetical protein
MMGVLYFGLIVALVLGMRWTPHTPNYCASTAIKS